MFDWFKRRRVAPKLSVSAEQIIAAMRAQGLLGDEEMLARLPNGGVMVRMKSPDGIGGIGEQPRPGLRPPADPEIDTMPWSIWRRVQGELHKPGWSTCRFPHRLDQDRTGWVFGIAKGDFGVFTKDYPVCHHPMSEIAEANEMAPSLELASICHLPSGGGLGVFLDRDMACAAVEGIIGLEEWGKTPEIDYSEHSVKTWALIISRVHEVWDFQGLRRSIDCHAHIPQSPEPVSIWERGPLAETPKKEVLS